MALGRPVWTGHIRLSLVTLPVKLYTATESSARPALRRSRRVGLGQLVMRGREYVGALKPCNRGMVLETLHFEDELRKTDPYFAEMGDEEPDEELLDLAGELIERKTGSFDASAFRDRYATALRGLIEAKVKGRPKRTAAPSKGGRKGAEVVDLMAALKKSVGEEKKGTRGGGRARKGRTGKAA